MSIVDVTPTHSSEKGMQSTTVTLLQAITVYRFDTIMKPFSLRNAFAKKL